MQEKRALANPGFASIIISATRLALYHTGASECIPIID